MTLSQASSLNLKPTRVVPSIPFSMIHLNTILLQHIFCSSSEFSSGSHSGLCQVKHPLSHLLQQGGDVLQQQWPTVDPKYLHVPDFVELAVLVGARAQFQKHSIHWPLCCCRKILINFCTWTSPTALSLLTSFCSLRIHNYEVVVDITEFILIGTTVNQLCKTDSFASTMDNSSVSPSP